MSFSSRRRWFTSLILALIILAAFKVEVGAMRPLEQLRLQSLPRGPIKVSGHNPCTHIPGSETGVCKLGGMNIAGNVMHSPTLTPPPAFPTIVTHFGVALSAMGKSS